MLLPEAKADSLNTTTQFNGGGTQCGEYTNQVITASTDRKNTHQATAGETFLLSPLTPEMHLLSERVFQLCRDQNNNVLFPATFLVLEKTTSSMEF